MSRFAALLVPALLGPIALAGCANGAYEEQRRRDDASTLARLIDDRVPGEPQDCLDRRQTNGFEAVGSSTLLYFQGDTVYRNDLIGQCGGLRRDDILVTQSPTGRLCRGDIARTVERGAGMTTGGCALGSFTPYRRPR